jgi:hypothetical protein
VYRGYTRKPRRCLGCNSRCIICVINFFENFPFSFARLIHILYFYFLGAVLLHQCKVQIVRPYISLSIYSQYVLGICRRHTLCSVIAFEDIYTAQNDRFERI